MATFRVYVRFDAEHGDVSERGVRDVCYETAWTFSDDIGDAYSVWCLVDAETAEGLLETARAGFLTDFGLDADLFTERECDYCGTVAGAEIEIFQLPAPVVYDWEF